MLTKLRREQMGFVFQAYNLLPSLTVYDNVALPPRLTGRASSDDVHRVLDQVGLEARPSGVRPSSPADSSSGSRSPGR